jgi:hypothetical protein
LNKNKGEKTFVLKSFISGFMVIRSASYEEKQHYLFVNQTMLPFEKID